MATKPDVHDLFQQLADKHDTVDAYLADEAAAQSRLSSARANLDQAKREYNNLLEQIKDALPDDLFAGYAVMTNQGVEVED